MFLLESQNKNVKAFGQECKEWNMCTSSILKPIVKITRALTGVSKPKPPPIPTQAKDDEEEKDRLQREMMAEEEAKQKEERQKRLQTQIRRKRRGGSGQRSLITGQGGGIGYLDENM